MSVQSLSSSWTVPVGVPVGLVMIVVVPVGVRSANRYSRRRSAGWDQVIGAWTCERDNGHVFTAAPGTALM